MGRKIDVMQAALVADMMGGGGGDTSTLQTKAITDESGYFNTDTVEGALQEIGAELSGVNTLIGSGVIV